MAAWLFGRKGATSHRLDSSNAPGVGGMGPGPDTAASRGGAGPGAASSASSLSLHRRPQQPALTLTPPAVRPLGVESRAGGSSGGSGSISQRSTWVVVAAMSLTAVAIVYYCNPTGAVASPLAFLAANYPCGDQWTEDQLVGKCFGLEPFAAATSAGACRRHCCDQGAACVTWQYQAGVGGRGCMVGGPVRLGEELAATSNWCEPTAPSQWRGHRVAGRGKDGQCTWGEALPFQCFGLGVERVREGAEGRLTEDECRARCCSDAECGVWQWRADKGCFTNQKEGHCETGETELPYVGGRKRQDAVEA